MIDDRAPRLSETDHALRILALRAIDNNDPIAAQRMAQIIRDPGARQEILDAVKIKLGVASTAAHRNTGR